MHIITIVVTWVIGSGAAWVSGNSSNLSTVTLASLTTGSPGKTHLSIWLNCLEGL